MNCKHSNKELIGISDKGIYKWQCKKCYIIFTLEEFGFTKEQEQKELNNYMEKINENNRSKL